MFNFVLGLPGLTLTMPLKTQEEIEIANDFVISSGLVQEVAETYELGQIVQGVPTPATGFQSENAESTKCASVPSSSAQSFKLPEDNVTNPSTLPPLDLFEIGESF